MNHLPADRLATWRAFLEAHAAVIDVLTAELADDQDLPLTWYDVMVQLSEAPGRQLRMQDLADAVLLSKSGLTRLVQRMQEAGLVERRPCEEDRRGTHAVLTPAGDRRLSEAAPTHVAGVRRHFTDHLDDQQSAMLGAALRAIAEAARSSRDG